MNKVHIIGVPITATNLEECVAYISQNIQATQGKYICVSNVHTVVLARENSEYFKIQEKAIMALPDGKPLSFLGRRLAPNMGRVTGPDLMRKMLNEPGLRHFYYGSDKRTIELLLQRTKSNFPQLEIVGAIPSVFRELTTQEEDSLIDSINSAKADIVWIGLGAPRQEILAARIAKRTSALHIGVGGAFKILSGQIPDAPSWMQRMSLEWLYRLSREPRRLFKRYLVTNTKFIIYQLFERKSISGSTSR